MMFPVTKQDAVAFFNLSNELHGRTSIIITTNKSPKEWAEALQDNVLTTALLDRILYRCEIINSLEKVTEWRTVKPFLEKI